MGLAGVGSAAVIGYALQEGSDSAGVEAVDGSGGAKAPVGRRGEPIEVRPGTNEPTTIDGRKYTGHSLDRMQGRGVPPSAVEEAIRNGTSKPGKEPGTIEHAIPGVKVITNTKGDVVTVMPR
ncbi:MAG: hypothetical protein ABIQ95_00420 [Bdellovibrionia bacterium]